MTRKEALELILLTITDRYKDDVWEDTDDAALAAVRALIDEEPVAYFLYDGEMYSQISEKYKTDSDVFPLYTNEVTK